jgi:LEA14-like dessication related protein
MAFQSKMIIYVALAGCLALMGGIFYYGNLDSVEIEQVEIELTNVELRDVDTINNQAKFDVTFLVKNPSDKTFTVPLIEYQLYGDGILLGSGQYSTVDISMPGRAGFFPDVELPLKNVFVLEKSKVNSEIYQDAIENKINSFSAEGSITTQSSWMTIEKEFKTGF